MYPCQHAYVEPKWDPYCHIVHMAPINYLCAWTLLAGITALCDVVLMCTAVSRFSVASLIDSLISNTQKDMTDCFHDWFPCCSCDLKCNNIF